MTEENIQAHLNDCSQHSSKFALFLQIQETPYLSFPSPSSKRDHEEMEQGDDEVMEGTDKKRKPKNVSLKKTCINQVLLQLEHI